MAGRGYAKQRIDRSRPAGRQAPAPPSRQVDGSFAGGSRFDLDVVDHRLYALASNTQTVNLAPADLRKTGATLDPRDRARHPGWAALGERALPSRRARSLVLVLGELGPTMQVRVPSAGSCPSSRGRDGAAFRRRSSPREHHRGGHRGRPRRCAWRRTSTTRSAYFAGRATLARAVTTPFVPRSPSSGCRPRRSARSIGGAPRAREIAAAGAHNLLFIGPPEAARPCSRGCCRPSSHRSSFRRPSS